MMHMKKKLRTNFIERFFVKKGKGEDSKTEKMYQI